MLVAPLSSGRFILCVHKQVRCSSKGRVFTGVPKVAIPDQHMFADEANVLLQFVLCFQMKAVQKELKHLQAALRAFPTALRSVQEALGHPPAAQGKCACCCKCCCQRRQPHPCHSPLTLLLLLLQGNAKHRSKHFLKDPNATFMVQEPCTLSSSISASACSAAALAAAANGMLLQAGRCIHCYLIGKADVIGFSH